MKYYKEFKKQLENYGVTNFDYYSLINNYGYHFVYKGIRYDYRHILNVYGADVDFWELTPKNDELEAVCELIREFD